MYRENAVYRKSARPRPPREIFRRIRAFCSVLFCGRKQRGIRKVRNAIPLDLAAFFGCGESRLLKIADSTAEHYRKFFLWKDREKTRKRWIEAPDRELKSMQRRILHLLYLLSPSPYAHGFSVGRSIVSNAAVHSGRCYVVKLDLRDFFPSITGAMILDELNSSGIVTKENRSRIEILLKLCLLDGRLPQGAPTSPAISNLVCRRLDFILADFARRHRMNYSRYADDLTFSSDSSVCFRRIPVIRRIVEQYGFRINDRKVHVLKRHQRQSVTGLVVNGAGKTSVPRRKRLKLRAFLHRIVTGKIPLTAERYAKLKGHVSLICMADSKQGEYFRKQLEIVEKMRNGA